MPRPDGAGITTIVFPAWKDALSEHERDQMGEEFEEIERRQFGTDGFEDAVAQIGQIEAALGYATSPGLTLRRRQRPDRLRTRAHRFRPGRRRAFR